jgi:hypothetical protein
MTLEIDVQNAIRAECGHGDTRLFRQASSFYWAGEPTHLRGGSVLLKHASLVRVGFDGQPDLGGWTTVTVTPEMVGQRIAIAVQVEVKKPKRGKKGEHQKQFIAKAQEAGVRAGFARSVEEAKKIIAGG